MSVIQNQLDRIQPSKILTADKLKQLTDPETLKGISCGISALDKIIYGIKAGLYVLSAERGTGKTWFAIQIAKNLWKSGQVKTVFFTLEMHVDDLMRRCLQAWSGLTEEELLAKSPTTQGEILLQKGFLEFYPAYEITFDYETFESAVEKAVSDGFKFIILDHLHLVSGASSKDSLNILANWASETKKLVDRLNIPILLIAQPTKGQSPTSTFRKAQSRFITSNDIKGSGAIGDAADVVLTISSERKDPTQLQNKECWISVEKNRLGGKMYQGTALYLRDTGEFAEMTPDNLQEDSIGDIGTSKITGKPINLKFSTLNDEGQLSPGKDAPGGG